MLKTEEQFITNQRGQKIAIVLPLKTFEKIQEDLHDLSIIAERKKEKTISFKEMKAKFLKK